MHVPWPLAMVAHAASSGALIGAWQGFWVAYFGIPAFIVTLAGMLIFRALTLMVLGNQGIGPFPDDVRTLANGFLPGYLGNIGLGPLGGADLFTLLVGVVGGGRHRRRAVARPRGPHRLRPARRLGAGCSSRRSSRAAAVLMFVVVQLARFKNLPWVLILLAVLVLGYTLVTNRAVFGRHIYAVGGNLQAASAVRREGQVGRRSGSSSTWACSPRSPASSSPAGSTRPARPPATAFELDAIAAAFIGGAAVQGGVGKVVGAIIGGLIMGVINNGMSLIGAPSRAGDARQGPGPARRGRLRRLDQAARRRGPLAVPRSAADVRFPQRRCDHMAQYVVGVDFGTLSGRAVVVRVSDGLEVGSAVYDYPHAVMADRLAATGAAATAGLGAAGARRLRRRAAPRGAEGGRRGRHPGGGRDRHRHRLHRLHGAADARRRHAAVRAAGPGRPSARVREAVAPPRRPAAGRPDQRAGPRARRAVDRPLRRQDLVGMGVRQGAAGARGGPGGLRPDRALGRGRRLDRLAAHRRLPAQRLQQRLQGDLPGRRVPVAGVSRGPEPRLRGFRRRQGRAADRPAGGARRFADGRGGGVDRACPKASRCVSATSTRT